MSEYLLTVLQAAPPLHNDDNDSTFYDFPCKEPRVAPLPG